MNRWALAELGWERTAGRPLSAEERDALGGRHALAAALAEDVVLLAAAVAEEGAHVLDDAEHGDRDLGEHAQPLAGVDHGDLLGRGDDEGAGHGAVLGEGQLDVAGAGGQVDQQVVELAPVDAEEEVLDHLAGHGTAPDGGFVGVAEHGHGDDLDAARDRDGVEALVLGDLGVGGDAEHEVHGGAVEVGVHDPYAEPFQREGRGQVGGDGALAHAPLARGDGDDALDLLQQFGVERGGGGLGGLGVLDVDSDGADAGDLAAGGLGVGLDAVAVLGVGGAQGQVQVDVPFGGELEGLDEAELHDALVDAGRDDGLELGEEEVAEGVGGGDGVGAQVADFFLHGGKLAR